MQVSETISKTYKPWCGYRNRKADRRETRSMKMARALNSRCNRRWMVGRD